ncbi:Ankyrin repeat-containing protein BDA1 [Hirschfeldia incana]|nr:Ankyrin repeat-containing protein BDA1 [Hirschfeldia incana]
MDPRLLWVAQSGSVTDLYSLIQEDPCILQNVDVLPFMHTPLHEASTNGKIDLAMELMVLKPSFAKKLNADGFAPLHLAIKNRQVELALELVKFDPSLVRINGRGGMTPLHLVAKNGDVDLLTEFLLTCPECIGDVNVNGETALHIAVIYDRYEELKVLRGWMQRIRKSDASSTEIQVLNKRDRKGNTALHLAASRNSHQALKQLLKCMSLNRNIQNKSGMTALDALRVNGPHMNRETESIIQKSGGKSGMSLSRVKTTSVFLSKPVTFREYCATGMARYRSRVSDGTRNSLLVITALIITATYQTAAQPEDKHRFDTLGFGETY